MMGPFETKQQARETPEVQAVYAAFSADPGVGKMAAHTHRMLMAACTAASVQLGAYDRRVLAWLSGFEPETAEVIAKLIIRAHAGAVALTPAQLATVLDALADAETYREREGGARCADCEEAPPSAGLCAEHSADFDAAQRYHDLTAELGGGAP